jgi:hypothetical protein
VIAAMPGNYPDDRCSWCGSEVAPDLGFRAYEPAGDRRATFCRLEHLVPWRIQGPFWEAGAAPDLDERPSHCAHCDAELAEVSVLLVRHRGEHRIADGFCSVEHMADWAKAGGRWR